MHLGGLQYENINYTVYRSPAATQYGVQQTVYYINYLCQSC